MSKLDHVKFGTELTSPKGKRYALTDADTDDRGDYLLMTPVGADGYWSSGRRRKVRDGETARRPDGWSTARSARSTATSQLTATFSWVEH